MSAVGPSPRRHLVGTLVLLERFRRLAGDHPYAEHLMRLVDRPESVPERVGFEDNSLKFDAYIARGPERWAWGLALNDRWEGDALQAAVRRFIESLDRPYAQGVTEGLIRDLPTRFEHTFAAGFDHPEQPPRLKMYLYEETWQRGVADPALLAPLLERHAPGCRLPAWLAAQPERAIGVVAVDLMPDGRYGLKIYLGAATPDEAVAGAPAEARDLAERMTRYCPLRGSWYYLTIRLRPEVEPRYAVNKIYNHIQLGWSRSAARLPGAWREVEGLFRAAGQEHAFGELREALDTLSNVRVVPTATALEDGGHSADVYCAAFSTEPEPPTAD